MALQQTDHVNSYNLALTCFQGIHDNHTKEEKALRLHINRLGPLREGLYIVWSDLAFELEFTADGLL